MRSALVVLSLTIACRADAPPAPARLVALDSLRLVEPDAAPFGPYVMGFVRDGAAETYLGEFATDAIQVYGPDGVHRRTIGREGSGPGEFRTVSGLGLLERGRLLAAADPTRAVIAVFDPATGDLVREVPFPGGAIAAGPWREIDTGVLIPVVGVPTPFLWWDRGTGAITPFGEMPPEWSGSASQGMSNGFPAAVPAGDGSWYASLQLVPGVVRLDAGGVRRKSFPLPATRRLGVPGDGAGASIASRRGGRRGAQPRASLTLGMTRLADGTLLVLHLDPVLIRGSQGLEATSQRYFVSLLRPEHEVACVDAEVPIAPDDLAPHTFAGDTLLFLVQRTTGAGEVERWLRPFLVDPARCDWIPLGAADDRSP